MPVMEKEKSALTAEEIKRIAERSIQNNKESQEFKRQINQYLNNSMQQQDVFKLGSTPLILKELGSKAPQLIMYQDSFNNATKKTGEVIGKHSKVHNIPINATYDLAEKIREPILILKGNPKNPNSVVMLTELENKDGGKILAPISLDRKNGTVNILNTLYAKDNVTDDLGNVDVKSSLKNYLKLHQDDILAINTEKAEALYKDIGLQLPSLNTTLCFDNSIAYTTANVKYPERENADISQFHEPITHQKLIPILNAKAQWQESKLETLKEKRTSAQKKITKHETKIEKLTYKAERLEDKNKFLKTLGEKIPAVKALIERNERKIKSILQDKLNALYDDFYKNYRLLHSVYNKSTCNMRDDVSYNLVAGLEAEYDKDKLIKKSDIFTQRTIMPPKPVEYVDTAMEALTLSVFEKARVDFDYMSGLTGMTEDELKRDLSGEIFKVPHTENEYQTASEYLSGDIRIKLKEAEEIAEYDSSFNENVAALKKALPEPLKAGDIDVKIGATWIPKELYQQFIYETFETPRENREDVKKAFWVKPKNITVDYSEHTNTWHIENKRADSSVLSRRDFGTKNMSAYEIMEHLLNLKEPKVYKPETYIDQNGDEKERRVVDVKATKIVQQKAGKIKQAFKDWIFKDPKRAVQLVEQYNRQFNSIRPREYDGSALRFPGMNSAITLKEHQKNAIAHALFGGNTLFAHCVGAGKSATRS